MLLTIFLVVSVACSSKEVPAEIVPAPEPLTDAAYKGAVTVYLYALNTQLGSAIDIAENKPADHAEKSKRVLEAVEMIIQSIRELTPSENYKSAHENFIDNDIDFEKEEPIEGSKADKEADNKEADSKEESTEK